MLNTGFVWVLLAVLLYGALHSLLASFTAKRLAERWLGQAGKRWYRLFFNLMAVISFPPVLALVVLLPDQTIYTIPFPWLLLTLALQGLAGLGLLYGLHQTGALNFLGLEQLLDPASSDRPRRMTVSGLYGWVRHPLYTCGMLLLWLAPLMSWNMLAFNLGATLYITVGAAVFEERKLLEEFGEQYAEYQKRTPMLVPGWRKPRQEAQDFEDRQDIKYG